MHENGETFSSKDLKGEKGKKRKQIVQATAYTLQELPIPKMSCRKCGDNLKDVCDDCEEEDECDCDFEKMCPYGGECEPESDSADSNGPGTGQWSLGRPDFLAVSQFFGILGVV